MDGDHFVCFNNKQEIKLDIASTVWFSIIRSRVFPKENITVVDIFVLKDTSSLHYLLRIFCFPFFLTCHQKGTGVQAGITLHRHLSQIKKSKLRRCYIRKGNGGLCVMFTALF